MSMFIFPAKSIFFRFFRLIKSPGGGDAGRNPQEVTPQKDKCVPNFGEQNVDPANQSGTEISEKDNSRNGEEIKDFLEGSRNLVELIKNEKVGDKDLGHYFKQALNWILSIWPTYPSSSPDCLRGQETDLISNVFNMIEEIEETIIKPFVKKALDSRLSLDRDSFHNFKSTDWFNLRFFKTSASEEVSRLVAIMEKLKIPLSEEQERCLDSLPFWEALMTIGVGFSSLEFFRQKLTDSKDASDEQINHWLGGINNTLNMLLDFRSGIPDSLKDLEYAMRRRQKYVEHTGTLCARYWLYILTIVGRLYSEIFQLIIANRSSVSKNAISHILTSLAGLVPLNSSLNEKISTLAEKYISESPLSKEEVDGIREAIAFAIEDILPSAGTELISYLNTLGKDDLENMSHIDIDLLVRSVFVLVTSRKEDLTSDTINQIKYLFGGIQNYLSQKGREEIRPDYRDEIIKSMSLILEILS